MDRLNSFNGIVAGMEHMIVYRVLNVNNARADDEGNYECKAIDHTHKSESEFAYIKIHSKNRFSWFPMLGGRLHNEK